MRVGGVRARGRGHRVACIEVAAARVDPLDLALKPHAECFAILRDP
jgi:hypothetical protein